jgi:ABC-2 type transport system ATP-binding protein
MIIETFGLRKTFAVPRRGLVEAVRGVDLAVDKGQVFGFLGPNGAGKTTFVRLLATLLRPSGGRAVVGGYDVAREPERVRASIGYVSQSGGVDGEATVRDNLLLQARLCGLTPVQAASRTAELLNLLDLAVAADRVGYALSGGQRRRLALALGLVHRPRLLFLDEPTIGLDPQGRARLWEEIHALRAAGTTVFLTTHYLEEADQLCDRLAIIDHGRIVAQGSPEELKRQIAGDVVTLRLGGDHQQAGTRLAALRFTREVKADPHGQGVRVYVEDGREHLPELLEALDAAEIAIEQVMVAPPSLDDVFLRQTGKHLRDDA